MTVVRAALLERRRPPGARSAEPRAHARAAPRRSWRPSSPARRRRPARPARAWVTRRWISAFRGQPATVSRMATRTRPPLHLDVAHHPEVDDAAVELRVLHLAQRAASPRRVGSARSHEHPRVGLRLAEGDPPGAVAGVDAASRGAPRRRAAPGCASSRRDRCAGSRCARCPGRRSGRPRAPRPRSARGPPCSPASARAWRSAEAQVAQLQDVAVADQPRRRDAGRGRRVAEEGRVERRRAPRSQSSSPAPTQTGRPVGGPEVVLDHVVPVAVGVEHRDRGDLQAPQGLEPPRRSLPMRRIDDPRPSRPGRRPRRRCWWPPGPKVPPLRIMAATLAESARAGRRAPMRIAMGSDEVTELTDALVEALREGGHEVELHGPLAGGGRGVGGGERRRGAPRGRGRLRAGGGVLLVGHRRVDRRQQGARARAPRCAPTPRPPGWRASTTTPTCWPCRCGPRARRWAARSCEAFLAEPDGDEEFDRRNVERLGVMEGCGSAAPRASRRRGSRARRGRGRAAFSGAVMSTGSPNADRFAVRSMSNGAEPSS